MPIPIRQLLTARRSEVARGDLARMWPGAARDVAALLWWRGVVEPVLALACPPQTPAQLHPDCPLCNPQGNAGTHTERQR